MIQGMRAGWQALGRTGRMLVLGALAGAAVVVGSGWATVAQTRAATALIACDVSDETRPLDSDERQMLDAINAYRAENGVTPLQFSPVLARSARWKTASLVARGPKLTSFEEHNDAFRSWEQRLLDCGYPADARFGENIGDAAGADMGTLLSAWKASPMHNENLLNPDFAFIGLSHGTSGQYQGVTLNHWVLNFGSVEQ